MMKIIVFILCFVTYTTAFGQEEKEIGEEPVICFITYETLPIFSKECENSEDHDCSNKKIQEFVKTFVYKTSDTSDLVYQCYIGFTVEKNCAVIDVEMKKSNGTNDFDEQILAYFNKMPDFYKPGYFFGKAIAIKYVIPVNYISK